MPTLHFGNLRGPRRSKGLRSSTSPPNLYPRGHQPGMHCAPRHPYLFGHRPQRHPGLVTLPSSLQLLTTQLPKRSPLHTAPLQVGEHRRLIDAELHAQLSTRRPAPIGHDQRIHRPGCQPHLSLPSLRFPCLDNLVLQRG